MTRDDADAFQDWAAMDGEQAFLLIERHADGFQVAHELMEAWARARVKEEREACAQIVERNAAACRPHSELHYILSANALAIRERGAA